jgi:tRNA(Ile)-lysidine synthase
LNERGVQVSTRQLDALQVQITACTTRGHQIDIKVGDGFVRRSGATLDWYNF